MFSTEPLRQSPPLSPGETLSEFSMNSTDAWGSFSDAVAELEEEEFKKRLRAFDGASEQEKLGALNVFLNLKYAKRPPRSQ